MRSSTSKTECAACAADRTRRTTSTTTTHLSDDWWLRAMRRSMLLGPQYVDWQVDSATADCFLRLVIESTCSSVPSSTSRLLQLELSSEAKPPLHRH